MGNRVSTKLAVFLHADVVDSTSLVQRNETLAHERIQDAFHRFSETIKRYNGTPLEIRGDALVAEFPKASDALCAALSFQQANTLYLSGLTDDVRPSVRVGIAMGEAVVAHHTVTGGGVVLAQRLEQLAEPGGVVIQGAVQETLPKRLPFHCRDLGTVELKGFDSLVRAYAVQMQAGENLPVPEMPTWNSLGFLFSSRRNRMLTGGFAVLLAISGLWASLPPFGDPRPTRTKAVNAASMPTLLVLPFANKSDDPSQDYFVDGISEDIIGGFSRLSNLAVLAWRTSSSFKGMSVPPQQLGKELGVSYIVGGSVRKSGDQLRISAELIEANNGKQLWAERYDRKMSDVFALQDEVTQKIVSALSIKLTSAEKVQLGRSGTQNLAAYETFLRGQKYWGQSNKEGDALAREAYERAIEFDPKYARAYGGIALTLIRDVQRGWADAPLENKERALVLAKKGVALGGDIPQTHWVLGYVYLYRKEFAKAEEAVSRAIEIAPNYADGYGLLALIDNEQGKSKEALEYITKAMRLNPYYTWDYPFNLGRAYYQLGRYQEAIPALEKALAQNENALPVKLFLTASYVKAGRKGDAEWVVEQLKMQNPEATLTQQEKSMVISNSRIKNAFLEDLRKAGLPE